MVEHMGFAFSRRFEVSKYETKNDDNKIRCSIKWLPEHEEHMTISKKMRARHRRDGEG
jgi:hypothetical protein